jgi:hypothetical protein
MEIAPTGIPQDDKSRSKNRPDHQRHAGIGFDTARELVARTRWFGWRSIPRKTWREKYLKDRTLIPW